MSCLQPGRVAEWLGRGLQNLVQRFKSARDLNVKAAWIQAAFLLAASKIPLLKHGCL